ncbi:MAG: hypothetical protein IPK62_16115 [Bacteroidetes bacterium]|nr:hypothetical protein [Bacteroidota bacterium]
MFLFQIIFCSQIVAQNATLRLIGNNIDSSRVSRVELENDSFFMSKEFQGYFLEIDSLKPGDYMVSYFSKHDVLLAQFPNIHLSDGDELNLHVDSEKYKTRE